VKLIGLRGAALAAAVACGIGGTATAAMAALPAAQAAPAAGRVVLVTCAGKGATRPASYIITCADANDYLTGLSWSSWAALARGSGKEKINTCHPNCAEGKFKTYPVKVELWRPEAWKHHSGVRYFSRMTLTYTKAVPKGYHRTRVVDLVPAP